MKMSEYRCVDYLDLCRLCAAPHGSKVNIFSAEGRKINLHAKISECLPVRVDQSDQLPKIVCDYCVQQIQQVEDFRKQCVSAQTMLEGCLIQPRMKSEGKVYIKEEGVRSIKPSPIKVVTSSAGNNNVTIAPAQDFLSSIVQAVGIPMDDSAEMHTQPQQQIMPQYTLTLDNGQTVKANQIQYTIKELPSQPSQSLQATYSQVDEFLKLKDPETKQNYTNATQVKQIVNQTPLMVTTASPQQVNKQIQFFSPSKNCFLPLTIKDTSNSTGQKNESQILTQVDNSKKLVMPTYVQMKFQPQITTMDGQTYVQLTPAPNQIQNAQIQVQQENIMPKNQEIFLTTRSPTGIKTQPQTVQFVNLASPATSNATITFQKSPGKPQTATHITTIGRKGSTTITRKTPVVIKQETNIGNTQLQIQRSPTTVTYSIAGSAAKPVVINADKPKPVQHQLKVVQGATNKPQLVYTAATNSFKVKSETGAAETTTTTAGPTCDQCGKVFKRREHLAQHMKLHLSIRPFKCEEEHCNKAFNRKEHLMRHVVSHTGKKNFSCEYCHKFFSRKDNLNKHKRKHPEADLDVSVKRSKSNDEDDEEEDDEEVLEEDN